MSGRKQTPDVLGAILGGSEAADAGPQSTPEFGPESAAEPAPKPARTSRPRKAAAEPVPPAPAAALTTVSPPAPVPVPPAKTEWEYLEVVFRDYRGWRPRVVNGRESGAWKNAPTLVDYLKQLGADGWELVSMSSPVHNEKEAYFKRQKR
jgi:hypothetical protein